MDKTLRALRSANPQLAIQSIHARAFRRYGRPLALDTAAFCAAAEAAVEWPAEGSRYLAALPQLDALPEAGAFRQEYCGQLDEQFGFCWGHSSRLNALEWHTCSEFNIATRPLVLLLAKRAELQGEGSCLRLDAARVRAFYLAAGEAAEIDADTLHFCPCEVSRQGFGCIVGLARGTNLPLEPAQAPAARLAGAPQPGKSPLLWAKNKWLLAHKENAPLIARGAVGGIWGENWQIHPID